MAITTVEQLGEFGQSVWLDTISRSMIENGTLKGMIAAGLRGMTSNPTIFEKAISESCGYDERIKKLYHAGKSLFEIYDDLTIRDIQDAADMFKPLYERTNGLDGYVSLEINPKLAYKAKETIEEVKRLHHKVNRPNVLLKVPATNEGMGAIEALLGQGINVNITLIFSLEQYVKTAQAFLRGMHQLIENKGNPSSSFSVASVFVSRIDTAIDKMIDDHIEQEKDEGSASELKALKGKAAVANAHLIYKKFIEIFSGKEFESLKAQGAHIQKVLWGSTGTKNPAYGDIKYIAELIARNTINTAPQHTFNAFLDHGAVKEALTLDNEEPAKIIDNLNRFGIDVNRVCAKLLEDGAAAFTASFESLFTTLERKAREICIKR